MDEEVSSANGSPRGHMGKSREAAEGLCAQQEAPKDTTKGQREPCSPPVLPTSLQVCKLQMSPTPLLRTPSWEHISQCIPKLPALGVSFLPKGNVLGHATDQKQGFTPFPGLKRRRKSSTDPTVQLLILTLVKICLIQGSTKGVPSS